MALKRSSKTKDAILYRARRRDPLVQREIDRLNRELPDVEVFLVCYHPNYQSARHTITGKIYCYGQKDLHRLPYPQKLSAVDWADPTVQPGWELMSKKFFREMEWGHQDLPILKFYLEHPEFDHYWVIEDDVRCSGSWTEIFTELGRSSADLLMTVVANYAEVPEWYWWDDLITGAEVVPLEERVKGFLPFCRLSAACLRAIDGKYREGWGGHYEITWANIARTSGLSFEDIGGKGSYTPPERRGRFYSCTLASWHLFPGTFIFRPPFHDTGVSEFCRDMSTESMLWHPVKV